MTSTASALGRALAAGALLALARGSVALAASQEEARSGGGEAPAAPGDAAPSALAPVASARAKKLAALKFDRRPSTILAARARPPGTAEPSVTSVSAAAPEGVELETAFFGVDTGGQTITYSISSGSAAVVLPPSAPAPVQPAPDEPEEAGPADAAAAEATAQAAAKKAAEAAEAEAIEGEMTALQRNVTLGDWAAVRDFLAAIPEADGKAGYERLVASLVEGPPRPQSPFANWAEKNFFAAADIAGLIAAAPTPPGQLDKARVTALGTLLRQAIDSAGLLEPVLAHLREAFQAGALEVERTELAAIWIAASCPIEAGEFLPTLAEASGADQRGALNLLARHFLARHEKEKKAGWLEQAWHALQAVLSAGTLGEEDKAEALQRAVEIAPRIRAELGETWLEESFSARPERGLEILAVIGASASKGLVDQARNADYRLKSLQLQTTAAEALLAEAPALAADWRDTLTLLAGNWLREAEFTNQFDTSTGRGPAIQRDPYGNIFYVDWGAQRNNPNQPLALKTSEVLAERPSEAWLALVADGLRPRLERSVAQLLLKLGDERGAFPYIEALAATHPGPAKELAAEFLRVWIKNHNPNEQQQRTNPYMFMYGFEERLNGIPLTRSKQERNLAELAEWIARLRALALGELDEELVAKAFTTAHSSAEVYRLETIERVFGALGELAPKTLAELVQTMRANLAGVWREPAEQDDKKTRRRQKDIQAEVVRGYEVARTVVERALAADPEHWALLLARAAVLHDENNYRAELERSSDFSARRAEAFTGFARAAECYGARVGELDAEEQSTRAHEQWFYAALGACDLEAVDHEQLPAEGEIPRILAALQALPGEAAARHADLFANALFTRLASVAPAVKYRYLRHGLALVPGSERTREARSLLDYYEDLVTEIRLDARLDGDARVGLEPFGLFVDLRHTREIEREAGGFAKYLVNQNAQSFSWNYGRPTEDYRDKFEEAARGALEEHFEVLSVTFNEPEAHSRALAEYGWRVTPYAYLLLKARGPEVDRVPPLRLDLDFLDTSGYAVLPIESPPLAIDATPATGADRPERPFHELCITQTLDERQAGEKKLVLEVQARAKGLVPALERILDLAPQGFERVALDDQGVSVTQFDLEGEGIDVCSERTWLVTFAGAADLAELPSEFRFGAARVPGTELVHQRFVDADLATVEPLVSLEARYGERSARGAWRWVAALVLLGGAGGTGFVLVQRRRRARRPSARFRVPARVSVFTVLGLLREIQAAGGLARAEREELEQAIGALEARFFGARAALPENGSEGELSSLAEDWVARCS